MQHSSTTHASSLSTLSTDFLKCGIFGWCIEVLWTGTGNLLRHDKSCTANTSILMFPIYGLAAFIRPLSKFLSKRNVLFRGSVYTLLIFTMEYLTGSGLKKLNMCPWDYSKSRYNIKGVIRLDYAPAWFTVGLFYEKILNIYK